MPLPEAEECAYQEGVVNYDFDRNLGAYPSEHHSQWVALSNYITAATIDRLQPVNPTILSEQKQREMREQEESKDDDGKTLEEIEHEIDVEQSRILKAQRRQYKYKEVFGTIFYTEVPKVKIVQGLEGSALTSLNMDKSAILADFIKTVKSKNEVLGEMQFAFLTFLLGENYESFEQWKSMMVLLCNCQSAMVSPHSNELFFQLVPVIYAQLEQLPKDFFVSELSQNNFITSCMHNLIQNCRTLQVERKIMDRVYRLQQMLVAEFAFKAPQSEEARLNKQITH